MVERFAWGDRMKRIRIWIAGILAVVMCLTGCGMEEGQETQKQEMEYNVMELRKVPEELQTMIEENKQKEIRMTYRDGEDLYLIRGYGEQETGGYSIAIKECSENDSQIFLDTILIGPQNKEDASKQPSYPCLILKIKMPEESQKEVQIE